MLPYKFSDKLMLRSPLLSFRSYSIQNAGEQLKDPCFQTALYLASPTLYHILAAKEFDLNRLSAKERLSVLKYFNRACYRPTPFGAFSSFSLAKWGNDNALRFERMADAQLHLMPDQELVLELATALNLDSQADCRFYVNPTLYRLHKQYRFLKTAKLPEQTKLVFALESYPYNTLIAKILQFIKDKTPKRSELIALISHLSACGESEAGNYFHFLLAAQIIVSETTCNIVGADYAERLPKMAPHDLKLSALLNHKGKQRMPSAADLITIASNLRDLMPKKDHEAQVFYAGLERKMASGSLNINDQQAIAEALEALRLLVPAEQPEALQQFIRDFKAKYDRQKVPLLLVLDPETGINYGNLRNPLRPDLLNGINFQVKTGEDLNLQWSAVHRLLMEHWCKTRDVLDPIRLTSSDLASLTEVKPILALPPSMTILFRLLEDTVFLENIGGVSGTAMIGRFTAWSNGIWAWSKEIAWQEEQTNPDKLFAEIGQLSDTHTDNINRRQQVYTYEIPINAHSTLMPDQQIALSDLYLSVADEQLVLESLSRQKVVIPRLSSAYNFQHNNLPVFRLLCDLQYQGLHGNFTLDLERYFPGLACYPRVYFKEAILCLAKWLLNELQIKILLDAVQSGRIDQFREQIVALGIPERVALTRHDQQLHFNLQMDEEIVFFADCIKGMSSLKLQEFILPNPSFLSDESGKPLINQFVAVVQRNDRAFTDVFSPSANKKLSIKRDHALGGRWIYLKLYCSPAIANTLLTRQIRPLISVLKGSGLLNWFFIRYHDSAYHIRLRLLVKKTQLGKILRKLKKQLKDELDYQWIREYQADTYQQELERYGIDRISLVEGFFGASSELVMQFLNEQGQKKPSYSYHSLAWVSVSEMLYCFLPDTAQQLNFLRQMAEIFFAEFSGDKALRVELDQKYRELKPEIAALLSDDIFYKKLKLRRSQQKFKSRLLLLADHSKRNIQLLADLIHMHLNRLFIDQQRRQELIVYYCLHKYQLSQTARHRQNPSA